MIGGAAGQGTGKTAYLLGKALVRAGLFVFNYRDYPSLIRGGHNFNILGISDKPLASYSEELDLLVALDQLTIDLHKKNLKKTGRILADVPEGVEGAAKNNVLLGEIYKLLGLPLESLAGVMAEEFPTKKELIVKALEKGYGLVDKPMEGGKFNLTKGKKYFLTGNEAIAAGAVVAGLTHYFAYPMTPATSVFTYLEAHQQELGVKAVQLENEIAVVNATIGASFAGGVSMCGTSGGGFDLMTEGISLAGMAEVPLVVYLAQRGGPSTGLPTYTSQADLKMALSAGHGEFVRLVVAPGDAGEAFRRVQEAIFLAKKYGAAAIILGDKHMGEDHFTVEELDKVGMNFGTAAVLGSGRIVRASGYEHDEKGMTVEDEVWPVRMADRRLGKMRLIEKEVAKMEPVTVYGKGKKLLIGWGSTKGAVVDALPGLPDWRFLQISWISPFPTVRVKTEIEKAAKVVLIEGNATGQMGEVIAQNTGVIIKDKILKYNGRAFTPDEVIRRISNFQFLNYKQILNHKHVDQQV